jgi:hypothetical protein
LPHSVWREWTLVHCKGFKVRCCVECCHSCSLFIACAAAILARFITGCTR